MKWGLNFVRPIKPTRRFTSNKLVHFNNHKLFYEMGRGEIIMDKYYSCQLIFCMNTSLQGLVVH